MYVWNPPSSRLAARLALLPHDVLVQSLSHRALAECAALLCANSPADAARAEAALAAHQPVPQWAVEGVLLSTDLLPRLLAPLASGPVSGDGAAAAACSAWAAGWNLLPSVEPGTSEPRILGPARTPRAEPGTWNPNSRGGTRPDAPA